MVDIRVGDTVRIYASVWNFCSSIDQGIYVHDISINTPPSILPPTCQVISGIEITFKLATTSAHLQCVNCNPDTLYSTLGIAGTDSSGMAYIDHTVTENDLAAYNNATASGNSVRILACITNPKGQNIIKNECSDPVTVLLGSSSYAIDFKIFENTAGILDLLSSYTGMVTARLNEIIPVEAGWSIASTEILSSQGIIRLYMTETGSWTIQQVAVFLLTAMALVIAAVCFLLFPTPLGIALGVIALVISSYGVIRLIDKVSVLQELVTNFETKDQNDTRLDQMIANVLDQYNKSPKTNDDCLNKLNGLRISYSEYMDTMQKDFSTLYTPAIKRTFESTADGAIEEFKAGTLTCEAATERITTQGAIAKSDVSTNFTTVYNINNPYKPPKKEDCWIKAPIGEGCFLSANTGMWIIGTVVAIAGLGITYWAVTRKPAETRIVFEKAKEEFGRARSAFRTLTAPAIPG